MTFSMYDASVPAFGQTLSSLAAILEKTAEHCTNHKLDPAVLLNWRLAPDMYPLVRQVQITTDQAKGGLARLAGVAVPSYPDTETTLDELKARLARTLDYVNGFKADQLDGSEDRDVVLKIGPNEMTFKGRVYLVNFVFPNFYFHATTAYAILRACGVEIGKRDFLGKI